MCPDSWGDDCLSPYQRHWRDCVWRHRDCLMCADSWWRQIHDRWWLPVSVPAAERQRCTVPIVGHKWQHTWQICWCLQPSAGRKYVVWVDTVFRLCVDNSYCLSVIIRATDRLETPHTIAFAWTLLGMHSSVLAATGCQSHVWIKVDKMFIYAPLKPLVDSKRPFMVTCTWC